MPSQLSDALDTWIAQQLDPKPSRSEAIRNLLELGLRQEFERDRGDVADKGAEELTRDIKALKDRLTEIPVHTDASPEAGMDTMRKALAQNDLTKLKNRRTQIGRRGNRSGD